MFVAATPDPQPFATWIDGLEAVLDPYGLERVRAAVTHEYEVAANWKLLVENNHECYHCECAIGRVDRNPEIHPELCRVSSPRSGTDESRAERGAAARCSCSTARTPCRWTGGAVAW